MGHDQRRKHPETPFGARLRAARKMAGLSMEDLAAKLDGAVTKQAISKYEQGRMMPSSEVLEKLVTVLKIATWGASPLGSAEEEIRSSLSNESPALFRVASEDERTMFRRAGLLGHLRRKEPGSEIALLSAAAPDERHAHTTMDRAPSAAACLSGEAPPPSDAIVVRRLTRDEGLEPLGERRARILRDWQAVAAPLDRIRFRTGERLSAKAEAALKYRIADHLDRYFELESILGQSVRFENPIGRRPARTREEVESAAARVRECWELGAGPIVNLLGLLEDRGIKVYESRGIEGFEGLSGRYGETAFIAVSLEFPADRVRFTAAHELGHLLCDFDAAESPEGECHAFGAAFLLPRAALEKVFTPSRRKVTLGDLAEIKETFGVSLQAIMYRAHALGFVSDRQLRAFRETLKIRDWQVTEPVAYEGRERATRFRRLVHYAVAADILGVERAAGLAGVTPDELRKEIGDIF